MKQLQPAFRLMVVGLLLTALWWPATGMATENPTDETRVAGMETDWGIEITGLRLTANGRMIDFRYRVLDPEKSIPLFERQTKPYLIDQTSGKVLEVPVTAKVGPLRNSNLPQAGRIYWMFFGNTGRWVKAGDKVTVTIGDFRAENLIVE
ncbi:MAG: hypothetical protein WBG49_19130 [Thermoanaerobaculia bacterium]